MKSPFRERNKRREWLRLVIERSLMDLGLTRKRAWVLGASAGMGRAAAAALPADAAQAVISSPGRERLLEEVAAELREATGSPVASKLFDVTDSNAIYATRAAARLGGLDILVVGQGGPPAGGFEDIDGATFTNAFELAIGSVSHATRAAVSWLRVKGGVIAYLTSSSVKEALPNLLLSNVMRLGVLGQSKSLSPDLTGTTLVVDGGKVAAVG